MAGTVIKGMFFNGLLRFIDEKEKPELRDKISEKLGKPLNYKDVFDYPVVEFNIMFIEVVKEIYPDKPVDEGMFEVGKVVFNIFSGSMLGKSVLPYFRKAPKVMYTLIPRWYRQVANHGDVKAVDLGEKCYKLIYSDFRSYPEMHHGVLQHAVDSLGFIGTASLTLNKLIDRGDGDVISDFELVMKWK